MDDRRAMLLAIVAVLLVMSVTFVLPYLQYFILAVLLAYGLAPVQGRLESHVGARIAAGILTAATAVAVIIPLVLVVRTVATDAAQLLEAFRSGEVSLERYEAVIRDVTGMDVALEAQLRTMVPDSAAGVFGGLVGAFGLLSHAVVGLGLTLFLLYYFLKDGDRFLAWLRWVLPMPDRVQEELLDGVDGITRAVLAGHVLIAVLQGSLAGLGLFVVGISNALFWTVVMMVLSLLPIVGSFMVWGPAAVYLFLSGQVVSAAALAAYGTVVVGISDDYLRPIVVDRYAAVSPAVIIVGVIGGLAAMGFVGVFIGPIVIGALRVTLDVYREEYGSNIPA